MLLLTALHANNAGLVECSAHLAQSTPGEEIEYTPRLTVTGQALSTTRFANK
jgi:hypothetical protein